MWYGLLAFFLGAPAQQPQAQGAQAATDIQAQWAEYYRSLGYGSYYGQQPGGQQPGQPNQPVPGHPPPGHEQKASMKHPLERDPGVGR